MSDYFTTLRSKGLIYYCAEVVSQSYSKIDGLKNVGELSGKHEVIDGGNFSNGFSNYATKAVKK